jgi:hypothetical protein
MNRRVSAVLLCLALAPLSPLWAEAPNGLVRPMPFVESAVFPPTNVELPDAPNPAVHLRLEDSAKGGVLYAGYEGIALLPGPPDEESFLARVEIEFLEANTSVEVRVIDGDGAQLNSVVISSPVPARWSGDLCEVKASQNSRMELSVKTGSALGTAYRVGREYVTTIPILSRAAVKAAGGGTLALSTARLSTRTPLAPGYSNYTRSYSWPGTSVSYVVTSGPPNTCGELHTYRNGSWVVSWSCWMYTDSSGYGVAGPWYITSTYPGQNQTDNPSYIKWPDGTVTTSTWSVIDTIHPTVSIYTFAYWFHGTATAAQWGSGFNAAWTKVQVAYQDDTTGAYWNSNVCQPTGYTCYTSGGPVWYDADTNLSNTYPPPTLFELSWLINGGWIPCDISHHCSVNVRVNDMWGSSATLKWQFL